MDTHLTGLASTFRAEPQSNARECLLEGDLKASLNSLVRNLADLLPGALWTHMFEKGELVVYSQELCGYDTYCIF